MKIVKKLSIGFLVLTICFCSCFKFVNAFYVHKFDFSSRVNEGYETYYSPLVELSFGRFSEYTQLFDASQGFYYEYDETDRNMIYEILDDELNRVYVFYSYYFPQTNNFDYSRRYGQDNVITRNIVSHTFFGNGQLYYNGGSTAERYIIHLSPNMNIIPRDFPNIFPVVSFHFAEIFSGTINLTYNISYYNTNDTVLHTLSDTVLVSHNSSDYALNTFPTPLEIGVFENAYDIVDYNIIVSFITDNDVTINDYTFQQYFIDQSELAKIKEVDNYVANYAYSNNQNDSINVSFTSWLVNAIDSFMSAEIFPNFSIGTMLAVIVAIPILIYVLRLFMGG